MRLTIMMRLASVSSVVRERQRLASLGHIGIFGLGVVMVLVAAFPDQSLQRHLESSVYGDDISQAYFAAWLRAKPDDHHLRLVLVRHQMQQGQLKQAEGNLRSILAVNGVHGEERVEARLMLLDLKKQEFWRVKPDSRLFAQARTLYLLQLHETAREEWSDQHLQKFAVQALALGDKKLWLELNLRMLKSHPETWDNSRLDTFAQQLLALGNHQRWLEINMLMLKAFPKAWDSQRLENFAEKLVALGQRKLALEMYARLLKSSHDHSDDWYKRVTQLYLADGHYQAAAAVYFHALPYTSSLEQRRSYFLAGLHILQSGNLLKESVVASETYLGPLANDAPTLRYLVQLSQGSNRLDLAEKYVTLLLKGHSV
jgi:tetratricopeptide (TPR) repeat protein